MQRTATASFVGGFANRLLAGDLRGHQTEESPQVVAVKIAVELAAIDLLEEVEKRRLHRVVGPDRQFAPGQDLASQADQSRKEPIPQLNSRIVIARAELLEKLGDRAIRCVAHLELSESKSTLNEWQVM